MSIYMEKRNGVATGRLIVEVQRDGKKLRKPAMGKREAKALEAEMRAGLHDTPSDSPDAVTHTGYSLKAMTIKCESLWDGTEDRKQSVNRFRAFMDILSEVLKDAKVPDNASKVTTPHVDTALERIEKEHRGRGKGRPEGIKATTLNRYVSVASKAFNFMADKGLIPKAPVFTWKATELPEVFYLTADQEKAMVDELTKRGHLDCVLLMEVQLTTGCRINELLNLKPKSIRQDAGEEDEKFYTLHLGLTKNKLERNAVLPDDIGAKFLALAEKGFPSYPSVYKRLRSARKACNLPLTQPTHAHRHTVATRLAGDGVNSLVLADFMGHQSIHTTRRYVHNDTTTKKAILRKMIAMKGAPANA